MRSRFEMDFSNAWMHLRKPRSRVSAPNGKRMLGSHSGRNHTSVYLILYRDLKPENILVKGKTIKIADFGFAKKNKNDVSLAQSYVGTIHYMPLQVLKNEPYSSKCDVWAIGCIFYEALHDYRPWDIKSKNNWHSEIKAYAFIK